MKMSFGHDIIFHNKGLQAPKSIVYLHIKLEQLIVLQAHRYYTSF